MSTDDRSGLGRRDFLGAVGGVAVAAGLEGAAGAAVVPGVAGPGKPAPLVRFGGRSLRMADLTHRLTRQFNFDPAHPRIAMESVDGSGVKVGMKMHRLALIEHTGTHIDAPSHFGETLRSLGEIPVEDLVVPLAVVDISARAARNNNAEVTPADLAAWEKRHGRLPDGCCVAIHSGWDPLAGGDRNQARRTHEMPAFGIAAARWLVSARRVKGIAVDAMSIDAGEHIPDYPVHQFWLQSGRWGIEGITNLKAVPPVGALLVVGAAPIVDATGMPIRAIALF